MTSLDWSRNDKVATIVRMYATDTGWVGLTGVMRTSFVVWRPAEVGACVESAQRR